VRSSGGAREMTTHPALRSTLEFAPTDDPRWVALVESTEDATPFHHPAWSRLIERCYGYRSFVLAERDANGTIRGGLPIVEVPGLIRGRRWISVPFADHCAPLGSFTDPETLPRRLALARGNAGISSLEVRAALAGAGVHRESHWVRHVLRLRSDPDAQFRTFHRMTRRNVRQAERSGLVVRERGEVDAVTEIFYALHLDTRRRLGVPVQPRRFFRLLWEELVAAGLGFVLIVEAGSKPVAGAVFLSWNGNTIYKFGASDPEAWHARPNNLLFWHAIRRAIERRDRSLDFGRSELDQAGLRVFKAGWGAEEEPLVYSHVAEQAPGLAVRRASELLAPAIRRSPRWVTRLLGELLYRHAA
jgi:CelD/BcsL family acetyltransferase involved in cellulose biosynthesis